MAERFRSAMGDTPLNHLRTLRIQKAMQLLADTQQTLEQVAQAVATKMHSASPRHSSAPPASRRDSSANRIWPTA
jgi:transcriptional regulator GlxA family with amidase domain